MDEDGDVGVGVFPEGEEVLIGGFGFGGVALPSSVKSQVAERIPRKDIDLTITFRLMSRSHGA